MKMVNVLAHNRWFFWLFLLQGMLAGSGRVQGAGQILSPKTNDAREVKVKPVSSAPVTNGPPLEAGRDIALEDLRALLHLYSRLDKEKMVEATAAKILARYPHDKETLLALASFYLERKDAPRALKYAQALAKFYSADNQARLQLALAYRLDGQPRMAKEVLADLKEKKFQGKPFPYEAELASAALASGDWPQAMRSYQEALENPTLRPAERREARAQLDQLSRVHSPQLFLRGTSTHFKSGFIFRSGVDWSQSLAVRHRLTLALDRDDLKLNAADILRAQWATRFDASVGLESDFARWRTKVYAGIGEEGPIYGGYLARLLGPDKELILAFHGNQRATDSLLLETLHGREDEVSLLWHTSFYPDISANVKVRGRRVLIDGETLGYGYGIDLNVERAMLDRLPELHIGYRGLVTGFSQESQNIALVNPVAAPGTPDSFRHVLLNNLITPINLHGVFLSWQQAINPEWSWHALAGCDYSFTRSAFGESLEAGVTYSPSRRMEFIFNAGYSTSASTSDQDTERLELSLAFRWRF